MPLLTRRPQVRLGIRISVASLTAYALSRLLGLSQTYPAVLTAVIVMQSSVGGSLKAMLDRFLGSLSGAIWSIAALLVFHEAGFSAPDRALMLSVVPLAFLAAFKPAYRAAPITAIILLLTPDSAVEPLVPAFQRVAGIGLGSVVALVVALLVFPARAHATVADAAGRATLAMGDLAAILMNGLDGKAGPDAIQGFHDTIRGALAEADAAALEADRERVVFLSAVPDSQPLCRALRRVRNDLAMVGRAAGPFPESLLAIASQPAWIVSSSVAAGLHAFGEAIGNRQPAPPVTGVDSAVGQFRAAIANARADGLTRALPDETTARLFGLAFAFDQLHQNLHELSDRVSDLASAK